MESLLKQLKDDLYLSSRMKFDLSASQRLDWDSNFFGLEIGQINITNEITSFEAEVPQEFDLTYLFCEEALSPINLKHLSQYFDCKLVDRKLTFEKEIENENKEITEKSTGQIKKIKESSTELLNLAFESGSSSRFKLDNKLSHKFEAMYTAWIENTLNGGFGNSVYGFFKESKLLAFVSLGFESTIASIHLIAVSSEARGEGLGTLLIGLAEKVALKEKCQFIHVVTQHENTKAVSFYKKNGFRMIDEKYIYHCWKSENS